MERLRCFFSILLLQTFVLASIDSVFITHLRAEVSNQSDLSPLLESFVSKGDRFRGSVSSKNRNLSNWASFGYYTGWLLHCDWSQKGRMDTLLEDALGRVEIPDLRKKDFTRWKMEWIEAQDVDCNQPEKAAQFELALDQWLLSLSPESSRSHADLAEAATETNQQSSPKNENLLKELEKRLAQIESERLRDKQALAALEAQKKETQQAISQDMQSPSIRITSANSDGARGIISAVASDNTGIAEVLVDGQAVAVDPSGSFTTSTFIPSGGIDVQITAYDLKGLSTTETVRLERTKRTQTVSRLAAVNPLVGPKQKPSVIVPPSSSVSRHTLAYPQQTLRPVTPRCLQTMPARSSASWITTSRC